LIWLAETRYQHIFDGLTTDGNFRDVICNILAIFGQEHQMYLAVLGGKNQQFLFSFFDWLLLIDKARIQSSGVIILLKF
jgi:hypothetical protein